MKLLKSVFKINLIRRLCFFKTRFEFIKIKFKSFRAIQIALNKFIFLIYFNTFKVLFADLNFNKEKNINAMIYYIKDL